MQLSPSNVGGGPSAVDGEEPTTRGDRFIKTAVAILGETGRTDFTVQEIVGRSKTSLRAFYQHFGSKDELLLALFERTMVVSVDAWRAEITDLDASAALKLVIDRLSAQPESSTQDSLNRALSLYNQHLAETRPRDYPRVLSPLHRLVGDIVERGVTEGVFRLDLDVGTAAAIVMQTLLGSLRLHWLGVELTGTPIDSTKLRDFCVRALGAADGAADIGRRGLPSSLGELFAQMGMRETLSGDDEHVLEMPVRPQVVNTAGALQGGLIATLADIAGGSLSLRYLAPGTGLTTADLFIRYLRPITEGSARAVARILRAGRRNIVAHVDVFRSVDGDLAATATVNFAVVDGDRRRRPRG